MGKHSLSSMHRLLRRLRLTPMAIRIRTTIHIRTMDIPTLITTVIHTIRLISRSTSDQGSGGAVTIITAEGSTADDSMADGDLLEDAGSSADADLQAVRPADSQVAVVHMERLVVQAATQAAVVTADSSPDRFRKIRAEGFKTLRPIFLAERSLCVRRLF